MTTPLLGSDIGERLIEPMMTEWVNQRGLPIAVRPSVQRFDQGRREPGHLDNGAASPTLSIT